MKIAILATVSGLFLAASTLALPATNSALPATHSTRPEASLDQWQGAEVDKCPEDPSSKPEEAKPQEAKQA